MAIRVPVVVPIPFDPPHSVTIIKLNGWKLEKARKAFFAQVIADVQERGGAQVQKDIQQLFDKSGDTDTAAAVEKVKADPLNGLDRRTLIEAGVKAYDEQPITPAWVDDLSEEEIEFCAREVMRLTKPALFMDAAEREADTKNA